MPPDGELGSVLVEARNRGLLGPGPIGDHLQHAQAFVRALASFPPSGRGLDGDGTRTGPWVLDLGAGGGVPGLILAVDRPQLRLTLLDSAARRCRFLEWAVGELGVTDRVQVLHARAEEAARHPERRGRYDAVVSRSFGPPAVTAECARGFLVVGGLLVVSEPPGSGGERWHQGSLAADLALRLERRVEVSGAGVQVVRAVGPCPEGVPRRSGVPRRRPLF